MEMKKGDLVIGLSSSDFQYSLTNSHCLMRVEHILEVSEKIFDKDVDMFVTIVALEHTGESPYGEGYEKMYRVNSKFFRKATLRDKANFMMNLI